MSTEIPVFCKSLGLVAIIAQYYRNVNCKIQKTEILAETGTLLPVPRSPISTKNPHRTQNNAAGGWGSAA